MTYLDFWQHDLFRLLATLLVYYVDASNSTDLISARTWIFGQLKVMLYKKDAEGLF